VQEVQLKRTGLESLETTPTVRDNLLYHRPIRDDIGTLDKLCHHIFVSDATGISHDRCFTH